MFVVNSYPLKFIENVIDTFSRNTNSNNDELTPAEDGMPTVLLMVPFFGKSSVRCGHNHKS